MRTAGRVAAAGFAAALVSSTTMVGANAVTVSDPIATGLAGPLQFEVTGKSILVGQSFGGILSRVGADGAVTDLVSAPGTEIAGVAQGRHGRAYFTSTGPDGALVKVRLKNGTVKTVADTGAYEAAKNPDGRYTYGIQGLSKTCKTQVPADFLPHKGSIDSHPYALAKTRRGLLVADAGANAILHVGRKGKIHTVAVLPPQPYQITRDAAEANGLPVECVKGKIFKFEAVPTDVEVTNHGLVVSTLPGGPEDPSLGARGSVYLVGWHKAKRIATGFLGASNVAVSPHGIYVSELFGNKVSRISIRRGGHGRGHGHGKAASFRRGGDGRGHHGPVVKVSTVAELNQPAGLEWSRGKLYVSTNVFGSGDIVTVTK